MSNLREVDYVVRLQLLISIKFWELAAENQVVKARLVALGNRLHNKYLQLIRDAPKQDYWSAVEGLDRTESAPIHLEGLRLLTSGPGTSILGQVVGNAAEPGTSVRLRFTFYGTNGALGTEPFTVSAPSQGTRERFEVSFAGQATAYRYELLSPPIP